jgi:hypothetical protein
VDDVPITVTNVGSGNASQLSLAVSAAGVSILTPLIKIQSLGAGQFASVDVEVYVPTTVSGSAISLSIAATYYDPYGVQQSVSQTVGLYSPNQTEQVNFAISQSKSNLTAGEVTTVTFTLQNIGSGKASNLTITIAQSQFVSVLDLPPRIPSLSPSSQTTFPLELYTASDAAGSAIALAFTVTYQDPFGITKVFTQSVGFYSPNQTELRSSPLSVWVQPMVLTAGRTNNLTILFQNVGGASLNNLTVAFGSPTGSFTWLSPNQATDPELPPGGNFTISGSLYDPALATASSTLQLSITYYQGRMLNQETRSVGLLSRGEIDLSLTSLTVLPQVVPPGQIVSLTLSITDVGIISADGVTASFEFPTGFSAVGSSSSFIGDMSVDSPSTITVSALVSNSTASGSYHIPVELSYFDNLRTRLTQSLNVTVVVASASQGGSGTGQNTKNGLIHGISEFDLGVVIVALVVLVALVMIRRARHSRT